METENLINKLKGKTSASKEYVASLR